MIDVNSKVSARAQLLRCGVSTLVLGAAMGMLAPSAAFAQDAQEDEAAAEASTPVSAQTDPNAPDLEGPEDEDAIIVTGQRRALQTSQGIKRNADTVVDSITATDIGAFPDKSVAEALQRVPGITVNRFAASSDTAHFSAEPSGVIVRGLPQVRSEFNGRDTFSANSSRGLSWGDISPELMAGVDTYKNQTAEMIEGGIAGSINLRTRVPFDAPGQLIQGTINVNYGDLSDKFTPEFSGFYSNRWDTGIGEIGVMGNFAYSRVKTRSNGIQWGRPAVVDDWGPGTPETVYMPFSINFLDNLYDRERRGFALAGQWRTLDRKMLVTAQFNRSVYENTWRERSVGGFYLGPDLWAQSVRTRVQGPYNSGQPFANTIPVPAPGTPDFTFDEDGNFQSGVFNRDMGPLWWGNPGTNVGYGVNDEGEPMFTACYAWMVPWGCTTPQIAPDIGTGSRMNQNRNMTQDAAINFKWEVTDRLRAQFDMQYIDSKIDNYDISTEHHSFADISVDATGSRPRVEFLPPTNVNQSAGGLANPNNYFLRSVMDHLEDSEGEQFSGRADFEYDIGSDWLDSIKFGGRVADRQQTVRWSTYNWANVANTWTDFGSTPHPYFNLDSHTPFSGQGINFTGYPDGLYETAPFGTSFFGGSMGEFVFVPFEALEQHRTDLYSRDLIGVGEFRPICTRLNELPDSCFVDNEIADVGETTKAVYAMLRFGGPNARVGGFGISGNVGLRYIKTENASTGFLRYPVNNYDFGECDGVLTVPPPPAPQPPPGTPVDPAYCFLSDEDLSFINGGGERSTAKRNHSHLLPSFNLRVDITDKWLVRFAASKAMSRPDIGLMKNFIGISASLPGNNSSDPRWVKNGAGEIVGVNPEYTANAFNPFLKPTTAWQFDISIENYFANVGSFSFAVFHKAFKDYIQYGSFEREVTRDGVTRDVLVRGPANGKGAKIQGFETQYQRFFDFLPSPFDGFGIQANYTYVRNKGVPNSNLSIVGDSGSTANPGNAGTALNPGALEGLSKHSYNLVGMYEKSGLAARLAYNWRSSHLVTAVDCCVLLPVWSEAAGFLDGSIRYAITDNVELSISGSNLLNTTTKLKTQVTDEEDPEGRRVLVPNGWFQNDRRFVAGARFRF